MKQGRFEMSPSARAALLAGALFASGVALACAIIELARLLGDPPP